MTNFTTSKKVITINEREVEVYDLSIGFIIDVENGTANDTFLEILSDATNLKEEDIKKLRKSEAELLVGEVMKLTYGEQEQVDSEDGEEKK